MKRLLRRPSPAMVVACAALLVSLGGTGYAIAQLAPNSVGTVQLKNNAVNSEKVKNFSLLAADFVRGQLPKGARGPRGLRGLTGSVGPIGPAGPAGPAGPSGAASTITLRSASVSVPGNGAGNGSYATRAVSVGCAADERAIAGATSWSDDANDRELTTVYSQPIIVGTKATGWKARGGSDIAATTTFTVGVFCEK